MAKYVDLEGLTYYDEKIKGYIETEIKGNLKYKGVIENKAALIAITNAKEGDTYTLKDTLVNYTWVGVSDEFSDGWNCLGASNSEDITNSDIDDLFK